MVQNTGEMPGNPLRVLIAPAAESESSLYEDDGESLRLPQRRLHETQFHQTRDAQSLVVEISAPEGSYRPAKRDLILETWMDHEPKTVTEQSGRWSDPGGNVIAIERRRVCEFAQRLVVFRWAGDRER